MKTILYFFLLIGLGAWSQGVSFAEQPTQATPKAASQSVAPDKEHSGKEERGNKDQSKGESQASGQSINKADEKHASAEGAGARGASAPKSENVPHGPSHVHTPGLPSGGKPGGNVQNRLTPGSSGPSQRQSSLSKPAATVKSGPIVKKTGNDSFRPVSTSAGKLPTTPSVNSSRSRTPGLAAIGGPAKLKAGNTAAISGTGAKYKF